MKLLYMLLFFVPFSICNAQIYTEAFEIFDNNLNGGNGYSNHNNLVGNLGWSESYLLMGYMQMYRATDNIFYLKKLIEHSQNVMQQRDDNSGRSDYLGESNATWISTKYSKDQSTPYAWIVHSGMITYPMADFAQLVINNPQLHNELALDNQTFLTKANWLVAEIEKTISAHNDQWDSSQDVYKFDNTNILEFPNEVLPFNMYSAMGRSLLMMYLATNNASYLQKVTGLASHFKSNLNSNGQYFTWDYIDHESSGIEDISHGAIESNFAYLCFKEGILFDNQDMIKLANTFKEKVISSPLEFANNIDGSGTKSKNIQSGRWLVFSKFNKDLYLGISELFLDIVFNQTSLGTSAMLGVANCALYKNEFEPITINRSPGASSQWAGITAGDFDNDGIDEFVAVRNFDGNFYMYEYDNGQIVSKASLTSPGASSQWAGITAGDFDNDGIDEFVAVRNFDGNFYMYEYDNGQIVSKTSLTSPGSSSQWAGITAGDFDNDGIDEFVAVRNFDGNFYMYEYDNGQIVSKASLTSPGASSQWAGITAGDFDNDGIDEFVAVRNFDGNFYMYEYDSGQIVSKASLTSSGARSQWAGITAGDFDNDGIDEFVAVRNYDGDFYSYRLENSQIESHFKEFCPINFKSKHMCTGHFSTVNDELLIIREYDSSFIIYKVE